jgi:hypothetical protein
MSKGSAGENFGNDVPTALRRISSMQSENDVNSETAMWTFEQAIKFDTSLVIVSDTAVPEPDERPSDIISMRVSGARPRFEARPLPFGKIQILDTGVVEKFNPATYRRVEIGSQIAMKIVDAHGGEVGGEKDLRLDRDLDGLIASITYRCSGDIGERLALTIHEGMESDPVERIEFGPRTTFRETFNVPLSGSIKSGRYVFVLWRTGAPTYACPEESDGWVQYGYFRRDITVDDIVMKITGLSTN